MVFPKTEILNRQLLYNLVLKVACLFLFVFCNQNQDSAKNSEQNHAVKFDWVGSLLFAEEPKRFTRRRRHSSIEATDFTAGP